jgi:hypothetical protein
MLYGLSNYSSNWEFNLGTGSWYENIAMNDSLFIQNYENEDFKTLSKPFFFSKHSEKLNGLFFSFLMRKGGLFFASQVFQNLKQNRNNLQTAINKTLNKKKFANVYVEFFDILLRTPNKLFPGLNSSKLDNYLPFERINLGIKTRSEKIEISSNHELKNGKVLENSDKSFTVHFAQANYSTNFLKVDVNSLNSETKKKFSEGKYKLKISFKGDDNMGCLIYEDAGNQLVPISKQKHFFNNNSSILVNKTGKYLFVILNIDGSQPQKPNLLNINLKFEIKKV